MTEKEKFEEIEKLYNSGNIPGILAQQNIATNKLATKRTELQQKLIGKIKDKKVRQKKILQLNEKRNNLRKGVHISGLKKVTVSIIKSW